MRVPSFDLGEYDSFGEVSYPNGGYYGPVGRDYFALFMVHSGRVTIEADAESFELEASQCALTVTQRHYATIIERGIPTQVSWCDGRPHNAVWLARRIQNYPRHIPISSDLKTIMQLGIKLGVSEGDDRDGYRSALGNALLSAFIYEAGVVETERPIPQSILRARRYLDANFATNCTIGQAARAAHITPQYLVSTFRKHYGVTPARYLWRLRLDNALHLLYQTGLAVSEIAYRTGYKNPYHFSRQVKQQFDCSPLELRKRRGRRKA